MGNSTSLDKGSHFLCTIAKRNLCFVGSACTFVSAVGVTYFSVSFLFSLLRQKNRSSAGRWLTKSVEVLSVELVSPQGQRCCQGLLLRILIVVLPELELEERSVCRQYSVFGIDFGEALLKCVVTRHSEAHCVVYGIVWRASLLGCGF